MKVTFKGNKLYLTEGKYYNGRTAWILVDSNGDRYAVATVNISEADVPEGHVLIKNWSENEGMLEALVDAGIVKDTGSTISSGFVKANICEVLDGIYYSNPLD